MGKIFLISALSVVLAAGAAPLEEARRLYTHTDYDAALKLLEPVEHKDAAVWALIGKAHYGKGDFKAATEALERAVAAEPDNSQYWDWLGKAWGQRASSAIFLKAPVYAVRCRKAFEKAVELDPQNREALGDLFSYYLDAPGFLGGGIEKAEKIARRFGELDEAEHQYTLAQLAKKRKDFPSAEKHLRRAMELDPDDAGRILDLAKFLAEQGRITESDRLFERARRVAPGSPKVLFERAAVFLRQKRNPAEARRLLEQYLAADLTPDDPPRREAEALLEKVKGG